jgi:S1-C subfamily serine protease
MRLDVMTTGTPRHRVGGDRMGSEGFAPNGLDVLLGLLLAFALVRGWRQGAATQVAALGGFVVGLLVGVWAAPRIAGTFVAEPGPTAAVAVLVVLVVIVLIGQGIGASVGLRLRRAAALAGIGRVDRVLGVGVGAAWLAFVIWILSGVLSQGPIPSVSQQIRGSEIVQALDRVFPPQPAVVGRIAAFLDDQGFPQVFTGPEGGIAAPPVPETADESVRAAAAAGQPSTVQIRTAGCGGALGAGSGFVAAPGFVVTNAHVVAGFDRVSVRDAAGEHPAVPISFDPALDIAVLAVPDVVAPPIPWADSAVGRGTEGASLGFPGGSSEMVVRPATVQGSLDAIGRDIYGENTVRRQVLVLSAPVERGDSGGPFVTSAGRVGGVVFAGAPDGDTGYALAASEVRPVVEGAIARDQQVGVGACRF